MSVSDMMARRARACRSGLSRLVRLTASLATRESPVASLLRSFNDAISRRSGGAG
ncbi:hypothetical protein Hanom_Chr06g00487731 [Helianthus anomalus]